jgi:secondary thiamine-phosphate synthase enzyme
MNTTFNVPTSGQFQFVDITSQVQKTVSESKISDGIVIVYIPHTTAGITINENADPSVQSDIIMHLDEMVPQSGKFRHAEGNSPAHIKASMMGSSVTVFISGGKLGLGTWQGVYFCEFDGPRTRKVWVKIIEG